MGSNLKNTCVCVVVVVVVVVVVCFGFFVGFFKFIFNTLLT